MPGLGQVYNGKVLRGCLFLIGTILGFCALIIPGTWSILGVTGILIWVSAAYDAQRIAKKINSGDISYNPARKRDYALFIVTPALVILVLFIGLIVLIFLNHGTAFMCNAPTECCGGSCLGNCNDSTRIDRSYPYYLNGGAGQVSMALYPAMYNYSVCQARGYSGPSDIKTKRYTEDQIQKRYMSSLIESIRNSSGDPDEQARIAISLVQKIPYDDGKAEENVKANYTLYTKYPYEVLAHNHGLCEEKAILLALLLKELGFGVAVFNFDTEHHSAVGIKAPSEYAYKDTGYAFIETTRPSIITDAYGDYANNTSLTSTPDVYVVSDGLMLGDLSREWADAKELDRLRTLSESQGNTLYSKDYNAYQALLKRYGIPEEPSCGVCTLYCGQFNMYGECERTIRRECKPECVIGTVISSPISTSFSSPLSSLFSQGSSISPSVRTIPTTSPFIYSGSYPSANPSGITGLRSFTPSPTSIFSAIQTTGKVAASSTPAYSYTPPVFQYSSPVYQAQPPAAYSSGPYTIWSPDGDSMTCSGGYCMSN